MIGGLSIWHWILVGGVVFLLFGGKFKISDVMGDVAKGIKAFKKGLVEEETAQDKAEPAERLTQHASAHDKADEAKKI
jgi:sec-independent protein translocase protein TatA